MNCPLRVGIVIPNETPNAGGAYSFQELILREILKRARVTEKGSEITYIPIYCDEGRRATIARQYGESISIKLSRLDRIASFLQGGAIGFIDLFSLQERLIPRESSVIHRKIKSRIDVVWSLTPSRISDQIPYITTIWDLQHRLQPFFPEISRLRRWNVQEYHYKELTQKAFTCIVGTNRGRQELQQFYGIDQSRILVNPFPCVIPDPISNTRKALGSKEYDFICGNFIIYPAQLWSHKNHLCSLLAIKELKSRGIEIQIVFTGSDKGYETALNNLTKELGLTNQIHNLGFVSSEELSVLYRNSLALFFPSFFGPDNIPPLEAMAHGTPALVADVPGARAQLKNAALYFNPNSYVDAANKIESVIRDNTLKRQLVESGFRLIDTLTPEAYVNTVEEHLSKHAVMLKAISAIYGAS